MSDTDMRSDLLFSLQYGLRLIAGPTSMNLKCLHGQNAKPAPDEQEVRTALKIHRPLVKQKRTLNLGLPPQRNRFGEAYSVFYAHVWRVDGAITMTESAVKRLSAWAVALSAVVPFAAEAQSFPAGKLCEFPVTITSLPGGHQKLITPKGREGIAMLVGDSYDVLFTNDRTGKTYTLHGVGGAFTSVQDPNDPTRSTLIFTGTYVLGFFPTDTPGPALVWTQGRIVVDQVAVPNQDAVWTLLSARGRQTDLCALLS